MMDIGHDPLGAAFFRRFVAQLFDTAEREHEPRIGAVRFHDIEVVEPVGIEGFPVQGFDVIALHRGFQQQFPVCVVGKTTVVEHRLVGGDQVGQTV